MAATVPGHVVVVGGGIIGCSVAYHLSELGVRVTVVERCEVACAASGKAGGFLAKSWCDSGANPGPLGRLARASFELHTKYGELFGDVGYRRVVTLSVGAREGRHAKKASKGDAPDWVDSPAIVSTARLGDETDTAQVNPAKLTKAFLAGALKLGAELVIDRVDGLAFAGADGSQVVGVRLQQRGAVFECDAVVIAMGPWSGEAALWFDGTIPAVKGQRAHSIVLSPSRPVSPHALFVDYVDAHGAASDPEVYPRPDGEVYVCGMTDGEPLPGDPQSVQPSVASCAAIARVAGSLSSALRDASVVREQACYLPLSPDGLPLIGRVPGKRGTYIASGHGCWGILNAPATGLALAELIVRGKVEVTDIDALSPERFGA